MTSLRKIQACAQKEISLIALSPFTSVVTTFDCV